MLTQDALVLFPLDGTVHPTVRLEEGAEEMFLSAPFQFPDGLGLGFADRVSDNTNENAQNDNSVAGKHYAKQLSVPGGGLQVPVSWERTHDCMFVVSLVGRKEGRIEASVSIINWDLEK